MADILVVDDSIVFRRVLGLILERGGHSLRFASNGNEGLAAVEAQAPNLVISDIAMPGMDGISLARRLKGDPKANRIPILMLTASADLEDQAAAIATSVDGFVTKPVHSSDILALVDGLVERPGG